MKCADNQLGRHPHPNPPETPDPTGKRREAASEVGEVPEVMFDFSAQIVKLPSKLTVEQIDRAETGGAVAMMSDSLPDSLSRRDQLMPDAGSNVVKAVGVVQLFPQHVAAAAFQLRQHLGGHVLFADVHPPRSAARARRVVAGVGS